MVRAGARAKNKASYADAEDSEEEAISISSEDEFTSSHKQASPPKKRHNASKVENGKSKKSKKEAVLYKDASDVDFTDAGEMDDEGDSDFEEAKPKKNTAAKRKSVLKKQKSKGKGGKKKTAGSGARASGRKRGRKPKYASSSEESEEELEDSEEEEEDEIPLKVRKVAKQSKKSVVKKPDRPKVGEMIVTAIKGLRDNPKKGSSLAAIKGFLAEEWELNIRDYTNKIKKYLLQGVESGEILQTRGKGASGRFTVPGLKVKKKRKANKLSKKWDDEQEPEYEPRKTAREEERERHEVELEMKREQRKEEMARRAEVKASLPKKSRAPRRTEWEVELIKAMKVVDDKAFYLVKWYNFHKATWEPEENLGGCQDLIDNFLIEEKTKLREDETRRRREEEEGHYEVSRILEVKFIKASGTREFLIRWKGHGPEDDSWEPEENLDCPDVIDRFMVKVEKRHDVSEKSLRENPKVVERLNYAASRRLKKNKRGQGFRVTYDGMDD